MIKKLNWAEAQEVIQNKTSDKLTFLTFTTEWCTDCKMMKPVFNEVANKFENNEQVEFINVDAEEARLFRDPNTKWRVLKVPTTILLKGDEIVEKGFEYVPEEVLEDWIDKRIA
ncbi:co-chaperone YbbN [Mycoplasma sp. OR1901]|uniref:thioredoxin family protein n=1 Tax=Mycoplasma sp. OR1901 TaxID=2742195 RepID=UPI001582D623|nr:thioredoxin family protein [Mycoplasma sp. OR1901]QKT05617.1 thioredoxin family protein [Mycoplasma sp. OR1901]